MSIYTKNAVKTRSNWDTTQVENTAANIHKPTM